MDRKIITATLIAALMGIAGIWLLLSAFPPSEQGPPRLPWDVERSPEGRVRAFGLTLGESRLAELRELLADEGKLSLFVDPNGQMAVEVFFDDIILSQIRADWVVTLDVAQTQLEDIYQRGLRISTLGDGSRKVSLAPEDAARLADAPVRRITYLPWKRLESRDIRGNFGAPSEILEAPNAIRHWIYPSQGLEIARDPDGAVVIQYLNPADFAVAHARLQQALSTGETEAGVELR